MRTAYHEKLAALTTNLSQICRMTGAAIESATQALLRADLSRAEQVITDHDRIVELCDQSQHDAFDMLALQQPVAGDLRSIFAAIQVTADVDRMGALAVHIAKIARRRHPDCAVPAEVRGCFAEMGTVAVQMSNTASEVLLSFDPDDASHLRDEDDVMDDLHRQLFSLVLDHDEWSHGVQKAVDVVLLGRFYERFADHAVEVGRRVVFEATGKLPAQQDIATY
ncbi:phosphate signaling complex protein PhoU [Mycolicibacterium chubuense]|nr:phosphate signaling complex protein PhoU [Mycolicibacterium chubuense]